MIRLTRTLLFALIAVLFPAMAGAQARVPVTFDRDVAPLLWSRCSTCHRPGQIAPFALLTFDDVRPGRGKSSRQ